MVLPLDAVASRCNARPFIEIVLPLLDLLVMLSASIFTFILAALEDLRLIFSPFKVFALRIVDALDACSSSITGILTVTFFDSIFVKEL